jgi:AraC-like DNA-binding protein
MPCLATVLGPEGAALQEKIMLAATNRERVNIMIPFFERKLAAIKQHNAPMAYAIKNMIHAEGLVDIGKLAGDCCLSRRQFERNFKEMSGFSPKLYMRIMRFQAATKSYGMRHTSLTDIAYGCGYYDQSHFIHDFKEFSGFHPREYFYGKPEGAEYRDVAAVES